MTPTLVIALHGTRHQAGMDFATELQSAVQAGLPGVVVELGWADVHRDRLAATVASLEGQLVIVPVFLTGGYHVDHDIPAALKAAGERAIATNYLGDEVVDALADRLHQAGPIGDGVIMASAGSSRPHANDEVRRRASLLAEQLDVPVEPGFFYAEKPSLAQAKTRLEAQGCRTISCSIHALAPGLYLDRVAALGLTTVAQPLGVHPIVVSSIVERYRSALARH